LLLDKKAEVNTKATDGDTPLDEAMEHGNKGIIDLLLQHGAKGK
jgi:ankyrin repeat protein